MYKTNYFPDFVFESSWEVCNKVGGIYTVLSTRAKTLYDRLHDNLVFIGPDCWGDKDCPYFISDSTVLSEWKKSLNSEDLNVKIGRWNIPGNPIAVLVNFEPFYADKNLIFGQMWEDFKVDSLHAYGDYDEASMFSYAAGRVVESIYNFYLDKSKKVIYHANEWMTGMGALYVKKHLPEIGTIFTTHATSIGRSICGNNKPLYDYLSAYNGDQMACELNMHSKHSIEKQTAMYVDCFTTVSEITANECKELLDTECDIVLPNGFDNNFVPKQAKFTAKRKAARKTLLHVANCLTGCKFNDDTIIISTSGRYEFRNKGIDVFIEAMNRLRFSEQLSKEVVAFIEVPGWNAGPRKDLQSRLASGLTFDAPLENPLLTHYLHDMGGDNVMSMCARLGMWNRPEDKVKLVFISSYLSEDDGITNMNYYDVVLANDLCVFPSYYEPWGYTPLESIAFKVPCVTTDLAGFGLWVNNELGKSSEIEDGVKVIHRTDYNYNEVVEVIKDTVVKFANLSAIEMKDIRTRAGKLSKKALWSNFIKYYYKAYEIALRKVEARK